MTAPQNELRHSPIVMGGYYLAVASLLAAASPCLAWLAKARAGLAQKLGSIPQEFSRFAAKPSTDTRIWFHAVSVGEFNALLPLLTEVRRKHPDYQLFVSTTTATGQQQAREKAGTFASVFYFPFDLPWITGAWLEKIQPDMVAIIETEIWPGFMDQCSARKIPVVLLNGRLSPRSFKGYRRWSWFFGPVVRQFKALAVQSDSEAKRFSELGANSQAIQVCGNLKFDGLKTLPKQEADALRNQLGLNSSDQVLVAGSTHEGEEQALIEIAKRHALKLVLVPRHPERFARVAQIIEENSMSTRRFSNGEKFQKDGDVYLLDTIGQLSRFYSIATIGFVGGTIVPVGGHNLAEPCAYSVPVVCGPHVHKQKDLAERLSGCGGLLIASDISDLNDKIGQLAASSEKRKTIGQLGREWLLASQGAVEVTMSLLEGFLPNRTPVTIAGVAR